MYVELIMLNLNLKQDSYAKPLKKAKIMQAFMKVKLNAKHNGFNEWKSIGVYLEVWKEESE